jgi:hypothetical protein
MSKEKWETNVDAEKFLGKSVRIKEKVIEVKRNSLGLKKLAAIDFLTNFFKYSVKYI